jgi:hypothetical protein
MAKLDVAFTRLEGLPETLGSADKPLIVMPFIDVDAARRSAFQLAARAEVDGLLLCIQDAARIGFIAVANTVFRKSLSPQFGYVAQDAFAGRNWLSIGVKALNDRQGGLLGFNDGKWAGSLAAFGLVDSGWARTNYGGDLFHPGYKRHYADVELTLIAMQQRKFRFDPLAMLVEVDWDKEAAGSGVDADDRLLYHRRGQTSYDRKVTSPALRRLFK